MIEVHKDALGNITGYFDKVKNAWVPPPAEAHTSEDELNEAPSADEDDAQEPEDPDMDLPELSTLTNDQLRKILEERGIPYHKNDTKAELIKLIVEANT